jgi:hypothetical protein
MLSVAGVIANCAAWEDVPEFGRDRLKRLRKFLPFENDIPWHDTLARALARALSIINVEQLEECVRQ